MLLLIFERVLFSLLQAQQRIIKIYCFFIFRKMSRRCTSMKPRSPPPPPPPVLLRILGHRADVLHGGAHPGELLILLRHLDPSHSFSPTFTPYMFCSRFLMNYYCQPGKNLPEKSRTSQEKSHDKVPYETLGTTSPYFSSTFLPHPNPPTPPPPKKKKKEKLQQQPAPRHNSLCGKGSGVLLGLGPFPTLDLPLGPVG